MKNQYFGDINDYRKYGLLRVLTKASGLRLGVCWMLTPDDGRADGELRRYLAHPVRWRSHDPELYDSLRPLADPTVARSVQHAGTWHLLPDAIYYSAVLPDDRFARQSYFRESWAQLSHTPLVFLDPDNGLEVASVPRGRKQSSKYLYWDEVAEGYQGGHSLVIYQHFPRQSRESFASRLAAIAADRLGSPFISSYSTAHVLFLLLARPEHERSLNVAPELIEARWGRQFASRVHSVG